MRVKEMGINRREHPGALEICFKKASPYIMKQQKHPRNKDLESVK